MRLIFKAFTHKTRNVPPEAIDLRTPEDNNGLEPSLGCRLLIFVSMFGDYQRPQIILEVVAVGQF